MSINFIPITSEDNREESLPVFTELARDLNTLDILVKNGQFYYVQKNDAIKVWILKALNIQTSRYTYRAYSKDYGNEITKLFGRISALPVLQSELERNIREALLCNPYIKAVEDFTFEKNGSYVKATFTVSTLYGEFEQETSYQS